MRVSKFANLQGKTRPLLRQFPVRGIRPRGERSPISLTIRRWMLCLCVAAVTGCGADGGSQIKAPENPTPLPDASKRVDFGGDESPSRSRTLERK